MSDTKYALVLCTEPGQEEVALEVRDEVHCPRWYEMGFRDDTPTLAVIYEMYPDDLLEFTATMRESGIKVGVYSSYGKAKGYCDQAFGIANSDTLEVVEGDLGGGET